jgi:hypothetical protein
VVSWLDSAGHPRLHWSRDGVPFASQTSCRANIIGRFPARGMHEFLDFLGTKEELLTRALECMQF